MKRLFRCLIAVLMLAGTSCSKESSSNNPQISVDLGVDTSRAVDLPAETPWFAFETSANDVALALTGDYLFVFQDHTTLWWVHLGDGSFQEVFRWPDVSFEDTAGSVDSQFVIGTDYAWFYGTTVETPNTVAFVGAEHQVSQPVWLFGQPIIVVDIGPADGFRGIGQLGDTTLAITNRFDGTLDPRIWIRELNNQRSVPLPSEVVFDRMVMTDRGPALWTSDGLAIYDVVAGQVRTLDDTPVPVDAIGIGSTVVITDGESLLQRDADPDCATCAFTEIGAANGAKTLRSNGSGDVFWSDGTRVFAADGAIRAEMQDMLDFVVYGDEVIATNPSGIWRFTR